MQLSRTAELQSCRYFVTAFGSSAHVSAPNTPTDLGLPGPIPHARPLRCCRRCARHVIANGDARDKHLGMSRRMPCMRSAVTSWDKFVA